MLELAPNVQIETVLGDGDGPGSSTEELSRALRLVVPSLKDHDGMAVTLRMMLRKRGMELVRMGVPVHG